MTHDKSKKQGILIIGMHRSGTSALARSLFHSGVYMGHQFLNSNQFNKVGYFENRHVVDLNDEILALADNSWDSHALFELPSEHRTFLVDKIVDFLNTEFALYSLFALKDPRMSKTLALWLEAFQQLNIDPKIIVCYRDPREVSLSLKERNLFEFTYSSLLYTSYLASAEFNSRRTNRIFLNYSTLLTQKNKALRNISKRLKLKKEEIGLKKDRINLYLTKSLKHHERETVIEIDDSSLSERIYTALESEEEDVVFDQIIHDLKENLLHNNSKIEKDKELIEQVMESEEGQKKKSNPNNYSFKREYIKALDQERITRKKFKKLKKKYQKRFSEGNLKLERSESQVVSLQNELSAHQVENDNIRQELNNYQNHADRLKKDYDDLKNSMSSKLGFALTAPLRYLLKYGKGVMKFFGLLGGVFVIFLKNPVSALKLVSIANIKRFFATSKAEHPALIVHNIKNAVEQEGDIKETVETPAESKIIVNIEEAIADQYQVQIKGWIIAKKGIQDIKLIDPYDPNAFIQTGLERKDVHLAYPDYDNSLNSGFAIQFKNSGSKIIQLAGIDKGMEQHLFTCKIGDTELLEIKSDKLSEYDSWVSNNTITNRTLENQKLIVENFEYKPLISILIPLYKSNIRWLEEAINNIKEQSYSNWELCMVDDCSEQPSLDLFLKRFEENDRVKIIRNEENLNISRCTNKLIDIATGEYVLFMDHDDLLSRDALFEIASALNANPKLEVIYSDEDKINEVGKRYDPYFKPDWSPELFLSYNYINHLTCVKKSVVDKLGGLDYKYDGVQDYEFLFRVINEVNHIHHIPKVLYHWRAHEGSIASDGAQKNESHGFFNKVMQVVQNQLDHKNIKGEVYQPEWAKERNLGLTQIKWPDEGKSVTLIIPTFNNFKVLKTCIQSLEKTSYKNYKVLIVNNSSTDNATVKYLDEVNEQDGITVVEIANRNKAFSYAYINNEAVKLVDTELILFLNDDTEVIADNWLSDMVGLMTLEDMGMVGAKLLYPNELIQHAGVLNGVFPANYDQLPDYSFINKPHSGVQYAFYDRVLRNYSSVTAACLLTSKKLFKDLGGFDDSKFSLTYNDVDLCLRCIESGKRIAYSPSSVLYHHESYTRGKLLYISEVAQFKSKYHDYIDPYYNPNLSRSRYFEIDTTRRVTDGVKDLSILFCTHNLNYEGAPMQLLEIAEGIVERQKGTSTTCAVLSFEDGPLRAAYEKIGCEIIIINNPLFETIELKSTIESVLQVLKEDHDFERYDSIVANTLECFSIIETVMHPLAHCTWIIHESITPQQYIKRLPTWSRDLFINAFNLTRDIVFVAQSTAKLFSSVNFHNNFRIVNNAAPALATVEKDYSYLREELGIPKSALILLNVGTPCERKGQLDVLKAFHKLKAQNLATTDAYLLFVGGIDNGYEQAMNKYIKANKLSASVQILPVQEDVDKYYAFADIFVCSSYNESYPRIILEALAYELPIVSTPVYGIQEQIIEHVNCLFYAPGDLQTLKSCLTTLINQKSTRKKFADNAKHTLSLLNSREGMIDAYHEYICRL